MVRSVYLTWSSSYREKAIGAEWHSWPGGMVLATSMEVLEAAAYMSFVLLAVFAIFELRIMARDRKTELMMRMNEFVCTKEFKEFETDLWTTDAQDVEGLRKDVSNVGLATIAEYFEGLVWLSDMKLMEEKFIASIYDYPGLWERMKPFALSERSRLNSNIYYGIEKLAGKSKLWHS
ncbi:MAG: hypothetical protein JSU93_03780 [Methanobacteriota archaeon]|nr:MAG: hypothetical protein JSU93_03780 [Euryarchaeota archaeon]